MWRILEQYLAEAYVIVTGVTTYIRDCVIMAFAEVGVKLIFKGENQSETTKVAACINHFYQLEIGKVVVRVDPEYDRPIAVDL